MRVAFTFDVESDFGLDSTFNNIKDSLPSIVEILNKEKIKSTFFVSGKVIENSKGEVLDLLKGNEISSHGYNHKRLDKMSRHGIEDEIKKSKVIFSEYGLEPLGFRAPKLCLDERVFDILPNYYRYDSSIVPFAIPFRYFNLFKKRIPHRIGNNLIEIPIGTVNFIRIPAVSAWLFNLEENYPKLLEFFGCPEDFVLMFHSIDFVNYKKAVNLPRYKYYFYYRRCGPEKTALVKNLIHFFRNKKSKFVTCQEFMNDL